MYVRRSGLYTLVQFVLDIGSFWPIWSLSARLRIILNPIAGRRLSQLDAPGWVASLGLILSLYIAASLIFKFYKVPDDVNVWSVLKWASESALAVCGVSVLSTFFSHQFGPGASRLFVACLVPVSFVIFASSRFIALLIVALIQRQSSWPRVAIIGDSPSASHVAGRLQSKFGRAIHGVIVPDGSPGTSHDGIVPVLGTTSQLAELVNREQLDSVIVVHDSISPFELARCNKIFLRMGLPVSCALNLAVSSPTHLKRQDHKLELSILNGLPMVDVKSPSSGTSQELIKRGTDLIVALTGLIILSPVMLLIALIVKRTTKGPVFEKAPRVGMGGRHFLCLKFRTTYEDLNLPPPPDLGSLHRSEDEDDHHVTPLGQFLRRYLLDELPQLINIIRGEMSLVGPRPLPTKALGPDGMSRQFFAWSEARARVRPGLTGLWQVGGRNSLTFENMIRLDLEYIKLRSFTLDLSILIETPLAVFKAVVNS